MLRSLTASDIANQISMCRSTCKGMVVVVEGSTDIRLYRKFITDESEIIAADSRSNVRKAVAECVRRKMTNVIGIVDRDMDDLLETSVKPPVFETDGRDLENTLIRSPALESVLDEYADPELLKKFEKANGDVRTAVITAASPIGALMYVSYTHGLNLSFKNLDFTSFISRRNLSVDEDALLSDICSATLSGLYSVSMIRALMDKVLSDIQDKWELARGHDAVSILAIGLRCIFGSYNSRNINDNALSGGLRLAYSFDCFSKTRLYNDVEKYSESRGMTLWRNAS